MNPKKSTLSTNSSRGRANTNYHDQMMQCRVTEKAKLYWVYSSKLSIKNCQLKYVFK